jgi:hypothetical protein
MAIKYLIYSSRSAALNGAEAVSNASHPTVFGKMPRVWTDIPTRRDPSLNKAAQNRKRTVNAIVQIRESLFLPFRVLRALRG